MPGGDVRNTWLLIGISLVGCRFASSEDPSGEETVATDTPDPSQTTPEPVAVSNLGAEPHSVPSFFVLSWDQDVDGDVQVEFSVDPGEWRRAPVKAGVAGANSQTLVGVPYGEDAEWRLIDAAGEVLADGPVVQVGELPAPFPDILNPVGDASAWLPEGQYLLGSFSQHANGWSSGSYWTWIVDRKGRPVWVQQTPSQHWTLYATVAVTKDRILYDEQTYWDFANWDQGRGSKVHSTYLDAPIESFSVEGMHHAFIQLPGGSLVWGSKSRNAETETLMQYTPGDAEPVELWNCRDDWPGVDNCESNSIWYDAERDSFLYSFYTTGRGYSSALVEVDRATGESLWWAGFADGGLSFVPADSVFGWQHGITWTPQGTLMVSTEMTPDDYDTTVGVREYEVDTVAGELQQVWSYDSTYIAHTNGDAKRLANGNLLHAIGSSGQVLELDADANVVWQLDCGNGRLVGRVEFIEDLYDLVSPGAK